MEHHHRANTRGIERGRFRFADGRLDRSGLIATGKSCRKLAATEPPNTSRHLGPERALVFGMPGSLRDSDTTVSGKPERFTGRRGAGRQSGRGRSKGKLRPGASRSQTRNVTVLRTRKRGETVILRYSIALDRGANNRQAAYVANADTRKLHESRSITVVFVRFAVATSSQCPTATPTMKRTA